MASLDKLASMEGWDFGEDDADVGFDEVIAAPRAPQSTSESGGSNNIESTAIKVQGRSHEDRSGSRKENHHSSIDGGEEGDNNTLKVLPVVDCDHDWKQPIDSRSRKSPPFSFLEVLCSEQIQTLKAGVERGVYGKDPRHLSCQALSSSKRHTSGCDSLPAAARVEPSSSHIRSRSIGSMCGDGFNADEAIVARLRTLLRREEEAKARERQAREKAEEETRMAYTSLETESKRVLTLEHRVRVLAMRVPPTKDHDSRWPRDTLNRSVDQRKRPRSLSPISCGRAQVRATTTTVMIERQAKMTAIADATDAARKETESALKAVEGFAALNRKLMDELRRTIDTREDLMQQLDRERGVRQQLEEKVKELLGGVLAAALKEKEDETRYERVRAEAKRLAASRSRIQEDYRMVLNNAARDRARLQDAVSTLETQLRNERAGNTIRAKEETERANMGFEEITCIRAGLAPRSRSRVRRHGLSRRSKAGGKAAHDVGGGYCNCDMIEAHQFASARITISGTRRREQQQAPLMNRNAKNDHNGREATGIGEYIERNHAADISGSVVLRRVHDREGRGEIGRTPAYPESSVGVLASSVNQCEGSVERAVQVAAVEHVRAFMGGFVVPMEGSSFVKSASDIAKNGGEDRGAKKRSDASRWAVIGKSRGLSVKTAPVLVEQVKDNTSASSSVISGLARVFSSSWIALLNRVSASFSPSVGRASDGQGGEHPICVDTTVPIGLIRRTVQTCGLVCSVGDGPTLTQLDIKLKRLADGKSRLGHREYFELIFSLAEARFAGEPKDDILDKLSRVLRPATGEVDFGLHVGFDKATEPPNKVTAGRRSVGRRAKNRAAATSMAETGAEEGLAGVERVLNRNSAADASGGRERNLMPFAALLSFCKDFELIPGLFSRETIQDIYAQLVYPLDTLLTPKMLTARERLQGWSGGEFGSSRIIGSDGGNGSGSMDAMASKFGLSMREWMAWLGLAAVGCAWFDKQRGGQMRSFERWIDPNRTLLLPSLLEQPLAAVLRFDSQELYNSSKKKMLGLLQWMEASKGKARMSSRRGVATVVPAFNL